MHWPMIQVKFVPLSMKDGASLQSFARARKTSMIESLLIFLLSDQNFWLQQCSVAADVVYILRAFPEMN